MISKGWNLAYDAQLKKNGSYGAMEILSDDQLLKSKGENFFLLSSVSVYDKPITVKTKKAILAKFNDRPDNVQGDLARIIVMDSGFKEGIDLFDINRAVVPRAVARSPKWRTTCEALKYFKRMVGHCC